MWQLLPPAWIHVPVRWTGDHMVLKNLIVALRTAFERPVTRRYPEYVFEFPPAYRGLHNLDRQRCIGCGICAQQCPNNCIEIIRDGKLFPLIDVGHCMFCGICLEVCPEQALSWSRAFELASWKRSDTIFSPAELSKSNERRR